MSSHNVVGEGPSQFMGDALRPEREPQFPLITKEQLLEDLGDFAAMQAWESSIANEAQGACQKAAAAYENSSGSARDRAWARLEGAIRRSELTEFQRQWFTDEYYLGLAEDLRGRPIQLARSIGWPKAIRGQTIYLDGRNAPKAAFLKHHTPGNLLFEVRTRPDGSPVSEIAPSGLYIHLTRHPDSWDFTDRPESVEFSLAS